MIYLLTHSVKNAAEKFPDKEAFRCLSKGITYAELSEKINQLAYLLGSLGVRKGDRVGVYLNRCLDTALAIYGVMNAGAAYVPLDPTAPTTRTSFLIQDCGIDYIITNSLQVRNLQKVLESKTQIKQVIGIDRTFPVPTISWKEVFTLPKRDPGVRLLENDLAYILYTSGSTGTPKGVVHTHYSGLSYARLSADLFQIKSNDRIGNHAPIFFDISTLGYFTTPFVGATTVIASDAHTKMPVSLANMIAEEVLSVWYSVPLAIAQMVQRAKIDALDFSNLRLVLYGGEPFPIKQLKASMEAWPQATFTNVYGPTEVNQCTSYVINELEEGKTEIPIGTIWENTDMKVVDEKDQVVQAGEIGELLIRSGTMMQGYWNRPDLNEKAFYADNTIPSLKQLFYRTGDLVRQEEDGMLTFIGRKDRQVKIRGYRYELDELTKIISALEAVDEVAVLPVQGDQQEVHLEVFLILNPGMTITPEELNNHLKNRVPHFAIPKQYHFKKDFPRTQTGKIHYHALKEQINHLE